MIGENLAAWFEAQQIRLHHAAGVVWWEARRGVLEPVAPVAAAQQTAFVEERRNIELLLQLTSKREACFAASDGNGPLLPWCLWRRKDSYCLPTGDVTPLTGWQLRGTAAAHFAELAGRHAAWEAVARFTETQELDSYMITCEDSGWVHEVECSHPDDSRGEELRRYWQHRIRHSEELLGLIHRPARHGAANTGLRWSSVAARGHGLWRVWRALAS